MMIKSLRFFLLQFAAGLKLARLLIPLALMLGLLFQFLFQDAAIQNPLHRVMAHIYTVISYTAFIMVAAWGLGRGPDNWQDLIRKLGMTFVPVLVLKYLYPALTLTSWYRPDLVLDVFFAGRVVDGYAMHIPFRQAWVIPATVYENILVPLAVDIQALPVLALLWLAAGAAAWYGFSVSRQLYVIRLFVTVYWRFFLVLLVWWWLLGKLATMGGMLLRKFLLSEQFMPGGDLFWLQYLVNGGFQALFDALWISLFIGCIARREWISGLCHAQAKTE